MSGTICADNLKAPWSLGLESCEVVRDGTRLGVTWSDGSVDQYPIRWLRFNCMCKKCWNWDTYSRITNVCPWDPVLSATVKDSCVMVQWESGHTSEYNAQFLGFRSFKAEAVKERTTVLSYSKRPPKVKEGGVFLQEFDFNEVISDDAIFHDFFKHMDEYGASLLSGSPEDGIKVLSKRRDIMLRTTNYGITWEVRAKHQPSNIAFTSVPLALHSDLPFYTNPPEIQVLHCIRASPKGGESTLSDGLWAAEQLRVESPHHFKALSTLEVDFHDVGTDSEGKYYLASRHPVIELDKDGQVHQLHHNVAATSNFICQSIEDTELIMEGVDRLQGLLRTGQIKFRLRPGDMILFNNVRILHGRETFTIGPEDSYNRLLIGSFTDWELMMSALRLSKTKAASGINGNRSESV